MLPGAVLGIEGVNNERARHRRTVVATSDSAEFILLDKAVFMQMQKKYMHLHLHSADLALIALVAFRPPKFRYPCILIHVYFVGFVAN